MKAIDLYKQLESDFVIPEIIEDWYDDAMSLNDEYICDNFKEHSMGLLCDFAEDVTKVYTAVFPSDKVLTKILNDNTTNAMLFLHHPLVWDLSKDPNIAFYQINAELLKKLRERNISIYNFHLPLDNFNEYSTSKKLADELQINIVKPYNNYHGAICGIIGTTQCKTVQELQKKYSYVVGHEVKLYEYGDSNIKDGMVSICAGGGNSLDIVEDMIKEGINVHITGISVKNSYSTQSHELEKANRINLIGGTHYSSEKFACIAICDYFRKLGLASEFIVDVPCLDDM